MKSERLDKKRQICRFHERRCKHGLSEEDNGSVGY